jgi:hypothetical protein
MRRDMPDTKQRQAKCQGETCQVSSGDRPSVKEGRPSFKERHAKNQGGRDRPFSKAVDEVT